MIVRKRSYRRGIAVLLCAAMFIIEFSFWPVGAYQVSAATRLKLSTAKSLAVANSEKIESIDMQIDAKKAARTSAVRSLRERERSMGTFRWSPLLNLKFPETPNEAEAFEFQFKPIQLDYNITTLEHKLTDQKLSEYESVTNLYVTIITSNAEISFLEERIRNMSQSLLKNKARALVGLTTEDQVNQQQKTLDGLKKDLTKEKKTLLRAQEKLGKKIGFSVTSGYTFDEEFITTRMNAETVDSLAQHAVENDHTVFEARQEMELSNMALEINYDLMASKYGGNIQMISGYIEQIQNGSSVNKRAFKKDYDAFLKKIDEPWTGSWKILFIRIPKEWLKGDLDGVRYIEDDPYVLYSAALDYQAAVKEYNNTCEEIRSSVADGYDSMMEARENYQSAKDTLASERANLLDAEAKNAIGTMSLEEYETVRSEYEAARSAVADSLSTYSKSLYTLDRTCCGAASAYFAQESLITSGSAAGGQANRDNDAMNELERMNAIVEKGATYSIRSIVSKEEFILYVDIPENFEYNITDFELWADNRQIGARTPVSGSIRHLKISVTEVDNVFIRLYNGNEFIDDCAIDPTASYGPLYITVGYTTEEIASRPVIGTFTVEDDSNIDMIRMRFTFDNSAVQREFGINSDVGYYNMAAEKSLYLFTNDLVPVDEGFTYMSFIRNDLDQLTLRMFAADGSYIGGAKLDSNTKNLYVDSEITNEDLQKMAARQMVIEEKAAELTTERDRIRDLYNAARDTNSAEADTAAMTYYKNRMDELDQQIQQVAATVTDDEVDAMMTARPTAVAEKAATMVGDVTDESGLTAEEVAARDAILKNKAIAIIKKKREEGLTAEIAATINEKQQELFRAKNELNKLILEGASTEEIEAKQKQMTNLEAEIKSYEAKKTLVNGDDRGISEEDIEEALLAYGDEIYSASASQLSDPMLYGSATGQWALAYLEGRGLSTDSANMRKVIENIETIQIEEDRKARRATMQKEYDKAIANATELEGRNTPADKACAKQLRTMAAAYKEEMEHLDLLIEENDLFK